MWTIIRLLAKSILSSLQTRHQMALENIALRQQLLVMQRQSKRPVLTKFDRAFWAVLSNHLKNWKNVVVIVKPETVIRWHKQGFRLFWRWKSRTQKRGRPEISQDVILLIRKMSKTNGWGAPRIHGELLKLGIEIAQSTVAKYMPNQRRPPSQTWRTFIENHMPDMVSIDFFVVPTIAFKILFGFLVLSHERRKIIHFNATNSPSAEWTGRQIIQAFPYDTAPRYILRDRDGIYGSKFVNTVESIGAKQVITRPRSPWQNPYVERLIGSLRRECLDKLSILNEHHLKKVVFKYIREYYHPCRTHLALKKDCPVPRIVDPPENGEIVELPIVGGLYRRYVRRVA